MRRAHPMIIVAAVLLLAGSPTPADSDTNSTTASATFELDGFSFFHIGAAEGGLIPAGVRIPISITPTGEREWRISVPAGGFTMPALDYPNGVEVRWRLTADASGSVRWDGSRASVSLEAPVSAMAADAEREVAFTLDFTTEVTREKSLTREGARLDPASGYLQLVASGSVPEDAAFAAGAPFYAVLSGTIEGLPTTAP